MLCSGDEAVQVAEAAAREPSLIVERARSAALSRESPEESNARAAIPERHKKVIRGMCIIRVFLAQNRQNRCK